MSLDLEVIVDPALTDGSLLHRKQQRNYHLGEQAVHLTVLSDEDITNLTNQFSIYGYIAFGTIYPEMIYQGKCGVRGLTDDDDKRTTT